MGPLRFLFYKGAIYLVFFWSALRTLTFWVYYMNYNEEAKSLLLGGLQKSAESRGLSIEQVFGNVLR